MRNALLAAVFALGACSASAPGQTADPEFGAKVRAYLVANPEVLEEALNALEARKTAAATAGAAQAIVANRAALVSDARDPVLGRADAPITVVEFFDYRCGYCKAAAPELLALVDAQPDVRVVMKELPILSPVSTVAAKLALAAKDQGKYTAVHRALMTERALDQAAVDRIARANGVDLTRQNAAAVDKHIADVAALAERVRVGGTPAFIIGDQMIAGADMAAVRTAIEAVRRTRS